MQRAQFVQSDFSRGELSRRLDGRFDVPFYYQGVSKLRNMVTMPQGGITRMPGTLYLGQAKYADKRCRLFFFQPFVGESYVLELGHLYLRIWTENGLLKSEGNPVELYQPYTESDIYAIQAVQSKNTLYLSKRFNPIVKIEKDSNGFHLDTFTIDENLWNNTKTYKAGNRVFWNGKYYRAKYENTGIEPGAAVYWKKVFNFSSFTKNNVTSVTTHDPQQSYPPDSFALKYHHMGDYTVIYNATSDKTVPAGTSLDDQYLYIERSNIYMKYWHVAGKIKGNITSISIWNSNTQYNVGDCCILGNILYQAVAINTNISPTQYYYQFWEEIEENKKSVCPNTITFMDRRLILAGNMFEGQAILGSKINDYTNFNISSEDDAAFQFNISTDREGTIQWAIAQDNLIIGTTNGEYLVTGGGRPITPTNIQVLRQSSYGSALVRAVVAGDTVLFLQKGGRKVREFVYSDGKKTYQAPDLTIFADHVTESEIVEWTYQQSPHPIVWAIRSDGKLIGLTYDRISNVWGWHIHETAGAYESICVQDGASGEDNLWVVVRRTVQGQTVRYIERFTPFEFSTIEEAHFTHAGLYYPPAQPKAITGITQGNPALVTCTSHGLSNGDRIRITGVQGMEQINNRVYTVANVTTNSFTLKNASGFADIDSTSYDEYSEGGIAQKVKNQFSGLSHLSGESVCALADGSVYTTLTVSSEGSVTLPDYVSWARIGIPYTALVRTMRLGKGELKRIHKLRILFYKTIGCLLGVDEEKLKELDWRVTGENVAQPPQLFTGYKEAPFSSTYDRDGYITLANDKPLPFTILSVQAEAKVYG